MAFRTDYIFRATLMVFLTGIMTAGQALAEQVLLERKFTPGRISYVEAKDDITQKTSGPQGDSEYTIHRLYGLMEKVGSPSDGKTPVVFTFDRAVQKVAHTSIGKLHFDTDDPDDDEASPQLSIIFKPLMGLSMTMEFDDAGEVASCTGMEAIVRKIDEEAVGASFWGYFKRDFTDERMSEDWGRDRLLYLPNKKVAIGDTWDVTTETRRPQLGTIVTEFQCKLGRIGEKDGRQVAVVSYTAKSSLKEDDKTGDGPKTELSGTQTGTVTCDVAMGMMIEDTSESSISIKSPLPAGAGGSEDDGGEDKDKGPQFMTIGVTVQRHLVVLSEKERKAQKLAAAEKAEARKLAAKKEAETGGIKAIEDDLAGAKPDQAWCGWGGPRGDFHVATANLAEKWSEAGPKKLWCRDLGDGYSAIAVEDGVLYTMCWRPAPEGSDDKAATKKGDEEAKPADDAKSAEDDGDSDKDGGDDEADEVDKDAGRKRGSEIVVALDAATGKTIWEYAYPATWQKDMSVEYGPGPNSTPLVTGDRVYTIGAMVELVCLDKKTGKKIWAHDLHEEYDAPPMRYGFGSSPFECKDNIIIHVGGEGHSVIAFDKKDGSVVWKNKGLTPGYATPQLIDFEGEEQLLILDGERVAGLDPSTGGLLWKYEFPSDSNISTPVWGEDNTIFISSAYGKGAARAIKLTREDGKTKAEEIWKTKKLRIHHGNAIRLGDVILGSSGDFGPAFLAALDAATGKVLWRKRGFSKATFVYGDGKLIILDEDGNLALTTPGRDKIKIHSKAEVCKRIAWTVPTLVGTKLYLRDRKQIMALDLSAAANKL
ncbi:MAG: DUF6263 family protein [Planctomycetota bacterium]